MGNTFTMPTYEKIKKGESEMAEAAKTFLTLRFWMTVYVIFVSIVSIIQMAFWVDAGVRHTDTDFTSRYFGMWGNFGKQLWSLHTMCLFFFYFIMILILNKRVTDWLLRKQKPNKLQQIGQWGGPILFMIITCLFSLAYSALYFIECGYFIHYTWYGNWGSHFYNYVDAILCGVLGAWSLLGGASFLLFGVLGVSYDSFRLTNTFLGKGKKLVDTDGDSNDEMVE